MKTPKILSALAVLALAFGLQGAQAAVATRVVVLDLTLKPGQYPETLTRFNFYAGTQNAANWTYGGLRVDGTVQTPMGVVPFSTTINGRIPLCNALMSDQICTFQSGGQYNQAWLSGKIAVNVPAVAGSIMNATVTVFPIQGINQIRLQGQDPVPQLTFPLFNAERTSKNILVQ